MNHSDQKKPISFDQAAEFYDATRGFPPGVAEQVVHSLAQVLPAGANLLETGIGTGRISLPLLEHGYRIVGVDLSVKMMLQMVKNTSDDAALPLLIQGDVTQLPLPSSLFDAVLSVHVLHLIWNWEEAIDEALRVLKPNGSYLIGYDERSKNDPQRRFRSHLDEVIQSFGYERDRPEMDRFVSISQYLENRGAKVDEWTAATWKSRYTLLETIDRLKQRAWSSTWEIPEDLFTKSMEITTNWARQEFGSLERTFQVRKKFLWRRHQWT